MSDTFVSAPDAPELAARVRARDRAAIARALNLVEDRREPARAATSALLDALVDADDATHRVGLTGPPGVGKSTLAGALARGLRARGRTVGVVAIDPSSVASGGALLGDRARMSFDPDDEGVFVRSLATEGHAGGLSWAAPAAAAVLSAAFDIVLVETTGVGQTETDVRHAVDTVVLVIQPGSGDALQFLKAGVMEIPDVLAVNKCDQPQATRALADLRSALATARSAGVQIEASGPAVLGVSAQEPTSGDGLEALLDALDAHRESLGAALASRRADGALAWTLQLFTRLHGDHGVAVLGGPSALSAAARAALADAAPPSACARLSKQYLAHVRA